MLRHRTSLPATGPAASLTHLTRRTRPTRATSSHPCQRCSKPSALRVCFVAGAQHPPLHEGTLQSRGPVASRLAAVTGASPCGQQTDLLLVTAPCRAARGHQAADTAASGTNRLTHNGHGYSSSRSRCVWLCMCVCPARACGLTTLCAWQLAELRHSRRNPTVVARSRSLSQPRSRRTQPSDDRHAVSAHIDSHGDDHLETPRRGDRTSRRAPFRARSASPSPPSARRARGDDHHGRDRVSGRRASDVASAPHRISDDDLDRSPSVERASHASRPSHREPVRAFAPEGDDWGGTSRGQHRYKDRDDDSPPPPRGNRRRGQSASRPRSPDSPPRVATRRGAAATSPDSADDHVRRGRWRVWRWLCGWWHRIHVRMCVCVCVCLCAMFLAVFLAVPGRRSVSTGRMSAAAGVSSEQQLRKQVRVLLVLCLIACEWACGCGGVAPRVVRGVAMVPHSQCSSPPHSCWPRHGRPPPRKRRPRR